MTFFKRNKSNVIYIVLSILTCLFVIPPMISDDNSLMVILGILGFFTMLYVFGSSIWDITNKETRENYKE